MTTSGAAGKNSLHMLNLPNILTLSRIAAIPLVVACFWLEHGWAQWLSAGLFAAACVTDWFDGYFARRYAQISRFGRFLDPIADKLLVAAALVMLVNSGQLSGIHVLAALIILAREILGAIAFLLLGDAVPPIIGEMGLVLIWIAAALTLITGYDYLRTGLRHMAEGGPT